MASIYRQGFEYRGLRFLVVQVPSETRNKKIETTNETAPTKQNILRVLKKQFLLKQIIPFGNDHSEEIMRGPLVAKNLRH